jgi:hypothetical protein
VELKRLIAEDQSFAGEIEAIKQVEKLLLYHRDLFLLLNNYIALPEFYDRGRHAVFQVGQLYIDGCELSLCVEVLDLKRHSEIAAKSGIFIAYCEIKSPTVEQPKYIAAAVTNRSVGRITVGKNAIFYDRDGKDWDAQVVQVIRNPVSLREAAISPFVKLGALISGQVEKITASRQKEFESGVGLAVQNIEGGKAAASKTSGVGIIGIGGLLAGGGVAIAALSSSIAYIAQTVSKMQNMYFVYTIIAILLLIMVPSTIIGYYKLRKRDIGMMLEACGWAINGRMRINIRLARELTRIGRFPRRAKRVRYRFKKK